MTTTTHEPAESPRHLRWLSRRERSERPPADTRNDVDAYLLPWSGRPQQTSEGSSAAAPPSYITPQGRDLRIDLLRGYFVLAMIVDHVRGASPLYLLTGGNRFFVSAAEGFILTSGLMAGLVYRRTVARDGIVAAVRRVWARAFTLYLLTVGITLLLLPLSEFLGLPWAQGVDLTKSLDLVVGVLTLHRTYYLADVLLLYTLLFALMPVALLLMADGKTGLLLGLSWLLWGLHQLFPDEAAATWPIAGNYLFTFSAWQLLFVNGLVLAYHRDRISSLTRRGAQRLQSITGIATLGLIALYGLLVMPASALPPQLAGFSTAWQSAQLWIQQYIFGKADLRPGRLVAAAIVFTFMFLTLTRQWRYVRRPLTWLLAPLGQNSLYAFTAHVVVVTVVALVLLPFGLAADSPWWLNAVLQVTSVLLIWLLAQRHVLEPTPRTRSVWRASPAAVAIVALVVLSWLPVHPALAQPVAVSDAVLARARAYGTPVPSVNWRQAAPANGVTDLATPARQSAAPPVFLQITPKLTPLPSTPVAPGAPGAIVRPGPMATSTPSRVGPTMSAAATPVPPTPQPVANPAASGPVSLHPAANSASSDPLPPLPPDNERLVYQYVGPLAGRAYALSFHSDILNRDMPYWIYLPPDYGKTGRRYPTLYALHGGGGNRDEWTVYGMLDTADQEMKAGTLPPFIIVLPQGDTSYWANWTGTGPRWGDYLAYEVVAQVDAGFGTIRDRSARAVGGLSMGAWGALYQAFTHPDIFGAVAASSPSLYPDDDNLAFLGVGTEFASKDPVSLAATAPQLGTLRIWIDVGDGDPWVTQTIGIHNTLLQRGIQHEWHLNPGPHAGEYWAEHVPDYLKFYGDAFAGR